MSDSVRPHRRQPTRLPRPWDSPGKNTGVGCHFLLQCMKGKSESEVTQSCPTLSDPMDCSLLGSSIPGIFQARVLEWGATAFSVSSFTAPLFFCLQASPASGSFPMSWLTRWPKYWSFSFSISPSSEHSVLISFRIDLFDLLAVQGTLESLLQHHNSKASILSLLYGPALTSVHNYWKNHSFDYIELCRQTDIFAF